MGAIKPPAGGWRIHNYRSPEPVIMGFEYEIDTRNQKNSKLQDTLDRVLPAHYSWCYEFIDNGYGYEIKSSVAPLRTIKQEIKNILPLLQTYHPTNDNDGGIHINISRNKHTNRVHNEVFSFLHSEAVWRDLCYIISGRTLRNMELNACRNPTYYSGYTGIITTRKSYAYEFRMFKAKPELLLPAVEFAHAVFDIALNPDGPELSVPVLVNHCNRYERYQEIAELLGQNGFVPQKKAA